MPEGMVPELLIVAALVLIAGAVFFVSRGRPREESREDTVEEKDTEPKNVVSVVDAPSPEARPEDGLAVEPPAVVDLREAPEKTEPTLAEPEVKLTLRDRLARSRRFLADRLADALGRTPDEETWDDIEAALIQADVGVETASRITEELKTQARYAKAVTAEEVKGLLAEELVSLFRSDADRSLVFATEGPTTWLVVGVNGTGKTTTIGKLAKDLKERGRSVALAAADTFRAAADEQLAVWSERVGAELVKHQPGADPGAVAFDAYKFASARQIDVLLVDTAGRLHTKTPLMEELGKVKRVIEKEGQVQEVLLVIDATAGQNGLVQAREFADAAGVTGVVLTKLDGTAKGGIAIAIEDSLGIPIKMIGVGEGIDDLEAFDPKTFVDALLD